MEENTGKTTSPAKPYTKCLANDNRSRRAHNNSMCELMVNKLFRLAARRFVRFRVLSPDKHFH